MPFVSCSKLATDQAAQDAAIAALINNLAATGAGQGGSMVGIRQIASGYTSNVKDEILQKITVTQYGATGDGFTDDTDAFIAAYSNNPGRLIYMPNPSVAYKITAPLNVPPNTVFCGETRWVTRISREHNGHFATLGDGAGFINCYIFGNSASYTGGCFKFLGADGRQIRKGVRASNFVGAIEYFDSSAGSQSYASDLRYSRSNATTGTGNYAIVIDPAQQLSAVPRKYFAIETDGTCAFDFGGCNDLFITGSFLGDLKFTPETRGVNIVSSRLANQLVCNVLGHNNSITGNDISPKIVLGNGISSTTDNCVIGPNSQNNDIENNSGNSRNQIYFFSKPYDTILTSSGVPPSQGNGVLDAQFSRAGAKTSIEVEFIVGSTTALGTGDLRFSLPQSAPNYNGINVVCGTALLNNAGVNYSFSIVIPAGANYLYLIRDTSGVMTFNSPANIVSGAILRLSAIY